MWTSDQMFALGYYSKFLVCLAVTFSTQFFKKKFWSITTPRSFSASVVAVASCLLLHLCGSPCCTLILSCKAVPCCILQQFSGRNLCSQFRDHWWRLSRSFCSHLLAERERVRGLQHMHQESSHAHLCWESSLSLHRRSCSSAVSFIGWH